MRSASRLAFGVLLAVGLVGSASATPLVEAPWLRAHLGQTGLFVLDIRDAGDGKATASYADGHVPGSVSAGFATAGWRIEIDGVPGMTPPKAALERLIGGLGIANDSDVVIVSSGGSDVNDLAAAARVYWTLKYAGHDAVSILDGGWRVWTADPAYPVATGPSHPTPVTFTATLRPELLAETSEVAAIVDGRNAGVLIDARPESQYVGTVKSPADRVPGHLPGAVSAPEATFFDSAQGKLKPPAELAALVPASTRAGDAPVISYCNTGHMASTDWFMLHEVLGQQNVKLYDGSMSAWTKDPSRPVATGG
jgi:thiosulfate/3-mercaptopyruvate sulfurtransferase